MLTLHAPSRKGERLAALRNYAQTARGAMRLSSAGTALPANPWVGNVRQLQNVIFRALTMAEGSVINADDLELARAASPAGQDGREVSTLEEAVAQFETNLLQRLCKEVPSSRRLAKRLGASHSAIAARLRRYGIGWTARAS